MNVPAERPAPIRVEVEHDSPARLDAFLAARLPTLSRSRIAQLLAAGRITLNGRVPRKSERPLAGDVILVEPPEPEPAGLEAEAIPLRIVYQDETLAVIDKPAGLVVHPAPGHRSGTLVNALLHHLTDLSGIGGVLRPGIVHRLDKDTSGLLLVAKSDQAHRRLADAIRARAVRRIYVTACWGHLAADELAVDAPIARSPTQRKRMAVLPHGRAARTRLRRIERWRAADLLHAELETGRTHQIRVHLAHIGHPVVGDGTYGPNAARGISGPARRWAAELAKRVPRQFLHAAELAFRHPTSGEPLRFTSPLPADLAAVAAWAAASTRGG
jgi:23S rRNA pseudouridine1911/1915/1917 synthase